ncbi:tripartite tricarboxylate transporter substrate binding protein [Bordetella sp. 15P40C-2]|uniref:Bug family tripartite tricarboxylate transporter substrate binding protein n=1 Tax=Bordetella sp. 15P40C-2 TaxID=2572246 RepID=UPI0013212621|nr:tripartite tricarboxylate transporter substrate binding protein [Bordetella sp. 15P40C-2]MVW73020.1 tripartite tricarboxylate transporter substrate binding protein [Bordetella sp. 15P40C-2]
MQIRRIVRNAVGTALFSALTTIGFISTSQAAASKYPDKPIRMVIGFPVGQSSDIVARLYAEKLSDVLKQTVFVENRPGATGMLAHNYVKSAAPDGYTIMMTSGAPLAIGPALYKDVSYDPVKDFAPVILTNTTPMFLAASKHVPVTNLQEMKEYINNNAGNVNYGSGGNGVTTHIVTEMFKGDTGLNMTHIPYKGAPAMITDLIAGRVHFAFETSTGILPQAKNGRVTLLGVTTAKRSSAAPDVPTLQEQGVAGFNASTWAGIVAPAGTPPEIVAKLNAALNEVLKNPDVLAFIESVGGEPAGGSPEDFGTFIKQEVDMWGKAVKAANVQVD